MMVSPTLLGLRQRDQPGDVFGRDVDVAHARLGGGAAVAGRDQHFGDLRGDCAHFHASACSRPPEPTIRTFMARRSVPEVAHAGEHHGHAVLVGRGDDFVVALASRRAASMALMPYSAATSMPSRNGKNASEAMTAPATPGLRPSPSARRRASNTRGHLAGADADRHALAARTRWRSISRTCTRARRTTGPRTASAWACAW